MLVVAVQIIGILSMLTFMFIGIWGFIILNQIYGQLKYKNYLLEKLNLNINSIKKDDVLNVVENSDYKEELNSTEKSNDENEEQ